MKKIILLTLTVLSFQSAIADIREPGRNDPRQDPRQRDDLPMCLKKLDNANRAISDLQIQIQESTRRCDARGSDRRETEDLKNENRRLLDDNNRLTIDLNRLVNDNNELRRQIEDMRDERRGRSLGFYSYAGCKDFTGAIDLKYIVGAEGKFALEAETQSMQKVSSAYSCVYGIKVGKTEELRTNQAANYCVAGCKDFTGKVDTKFIKSGNGRNETEAQFNAIKAVSTAFSCVYGIQVQNCQ